MSAFLGPVHHWLYGKIQYQEKINQLLLKEYDQINKMELESKLGQMPEGALENIIDHTQIHQWLSIQVESVEARLAHIIENIENDKLEAIGTIFYNEGQLEGIGENFQTVQDALTAMNRHLLDGMPCDKGVKLISETEKELIFEYNPAVHQAFKDYQNFMKLRTKWIEGFLINSKISVNQVGTTTLQLKMEE